MSIVKPRGKYVLLSKITLDMIADQMKITKDNPLLIMDVIKNGPTKYVYAMIFDPCEGLTGYNKK